jgi:hypothetical protein
MQKPHLIHATAIGFLLLATACNPAPPVPEGDEGQIQSEVEEQADAGNDSATSGDLVLPDICELLPAEEVAALAGGTLSSEPNSSEYSDDFKSCWYDFDLSDGSYDYYIIYVQPAAFLEIVFEDAAEPVSGLGDRAQLKWEEGEEQYRLAIIDGNVGVEVIGKRSDVMMELARLVLERL